MLMHDRYDWIKVSALLAIPKRTKCAEVPLAAFAFYDRQYWVHRAYVAYYGKRRCWWVRWGRESPNPDMQFATEEEAKAYAEVLVKLEAVT